MSAQTKVEVFWNEYDATVGKGWAFRISNTHGPVVSENIADLKPMASDDDVKAAMSAVLAAYGIEETAGKLDHTEGGMMDFPYCVFQI